MCVPVGWLFFFNLIYFILFHSKFLSLSLSSVFFLLLLLKKRLFSESKQKYDEASKDIIKNVLSACGKKRICIPYIIVYTGQPFFLGTALRRGKPKRGVCVFLTGCRFFSRVCVGVFLFFLKKQASMCPCWPRREMSSRFWMWSQVLLKFRLESVLMSARRCWWKKIGKKKTVLLSPEQFFTSLCTMRVRE